MSDRPVIEIPVDDVLDKLGHGDNWVQRGWTDDDGRMCLHQGIRVCQPQPGDAYLIEQVAAHQGWGTDWNDRDGTSFDDVKQVLVAHREVFPHELEDTFGPQWEHVVALMRRAAALTAEETEQLAAARAAAWDTAGDTAWDAARNTARNTARNAAGNAVGNAARDAALALVVRDLIGQHRFTQEHYDTLTDPWRAVIGPVHPDDEAVAS